MVFDHRATGKMKPSARSQSHNDLKIINARNQANGLVPPSAPVNVSNELSNDHKSGLSAELLQRLSRILSSQEDVQADKEFDVQTGDFERDGDSARRPSFCKDLVVSNKVDGEMWPKFCSDKSKQAHFPMVAIESLLWLLCGYHQADARRQEQLYLEVCGKLCDYKVIGKTFMIRQLQPHRLKIANFIDNAIKGTNSKICLPSIKFPDLNEQKYFPLSRFMPFDVDRYTEDFRDEALIAKGGFGAVYKATHRLDNVTYAVKKIGFLVQSNEDFNKIIREVQLYANLPPHANVVTYKTTWIYYSINSSKSKSIGFESHDVTDDAELVTEKTNSVFNTHTRTSYTAFSAAYGKDDEHPPVLIEEDDEDSSIQFEEISGDGLRSVMKRATATSSVKIRELSDSEVGSSRAMVDCIVGEVSEVSKRRSTFYSPSEDDESRGIVIAKSRRRTLSEKSDHASKSFSDTAVDYGYVMVPTGDSDSLPPINFDRHGFAHGYIEQASEMKLHATLYIQMELCGQNLKTFIKNRNADVFEQYRAAKLKSLVTLDILDFVDLRQALDIFRQIVKGVDFLHTHSLIHRDLKPQNIMFSMDDTVVKIGDFGLATLHDNSVKLEKPKFLSPQAPTGDGHTADIGTTVYASPEQRRTNNYDVKTDMYSLGVIFFELVYPIVTAMEKGKCVDKIKSRDLPNNLTKKWPHVAEAILKLTDIRPRNRPSANDLLRSSLFPSKVLLGSKATARKIADLERTIAQLRQQLAESLGREERLRQELGSLKSTG